MKIESNKKGTITLEFTDAGYKTSHSVDSNLLFAILEKLEDIRCCIIDVESEVTQLKQSERWMWDW